MMMLPRLCCGPKEKLTVPQGEEPGLADLCPLGKGISVNLGNDWWESWDTVLQTFAYFSSLLEDKIPVSLEGIFVRHNNSRE